MLKLQLIARLQLCKMPLRKAVRCWKLQIARDVDKMWWDYEPMLVYGCWRSRSPYQVAEPHPFSSAASKYNTGKVFHPTYDSYLTALCEGDYFYLGYKPVPDPPQFRMTAP